MNDLPTMTEEGTALVICVAIGAGMFLSAPWIGYLLERYFVWCQRIIDGWTRR